MNIEILDYSEAYRKKTEIQLSLLQESLSFVLVSTEEP